VKDGELPLIIVSVAGYPAVRDQTLLAASEQRLAVQSGAAVYRVRVGEGLDDCHPHLSESITIREACPDPIELGLVVLGDDESPSGTQAAVQAASLAGFQRIIVKRNAPELVDAAAPLEVHVVDL